MLDYLYDFSPHLINKFQHIFALKKKLQTYFTIQVGSTEILEENPLAWRNWGWAY